LTRKSLSKKAQKYRDEVLQRIRKSAESRHPKALFEDGRYGMVIVSLELDKKGIYIKRA